MSNLFVEHQNGGLCRMHALNAFFGKAKITPSEFDQYCSDFDQDNKKYNSTTSCRDFDLVNSNQSNVVSYVLKRHGIWTQYYALNQLNMTNNNYAEFKLPDHVTGNFIFVYNPGHIWGIKFQNGAWWKLDSLSPIPTQVNLNQILQEKNIGIIIPVKMQKEFYIKLNELKRIIPNELNDIIQCLTNLNENKKILGNIEIPLNICIDILEWQGRLCPKSDMKFEPIRNIIWRYNEFLIQFTDGNYLNLKLILDYLPDIIYKLINF